MKKNKQINIKRLQLYDNIGYSSLIFAVSLAIIRLTKSINKKDLAEVIGYKSRVSEILSRKRKLSLNMTGQLHKKLRIPYDSLLNEY